MVQPDIRMKFNCCDEFIASEVTRQEFANSKKLNHHRKKLGNTGPLISQEVYYWCMCPWHVTFLGKKYYYYSGCGIIQIRCLLYCTFDYVYDEALLRIKGILTFFNILSNQSPRSFLSRELCCASVLD